MTTIFTTHILRQAGKIFTLMACLTVICGCNILDNEECEGPVEVVFSMMAGPRAVDTQWSPGDDMGVFMIKAGQTLSTANIVADGNNKRYITPNGNGNFWSFDEFQKIYYPENGDYVDFVCYHPYKATLNNFIYKIDVSDQTDTENIDLLYSNNARNLNKNNKVAPLVFSHRLSNLIFNISAGGLLTDADLPGLVLKVSNLYLTADFDLSDASIMQTGNKGTVIPNVTPNGKRAEAIVIPVPAANQTLRSISIKLQGYDELIHTIDDAKIFESGFQYNYDIVVYHDKIEIKECEITDWNKEQVYEDDLYTPNGLNFPNCYIVPPGGEQEIPVLKAFAVWTTQYFLDTSNPLFDPKGTVTTKLVWEEHKGLIRSLNVTGVNKTAKITVKTSPSMTGNAVVGAYIDGILRWSWHIWVTDYDPQTLYVVYNNGTETTTIMDRNLGAIANHPSINRLGTYGMYYQWGRKDPFPGPDAPTGGTTPKFINVYGPNGETLTVTSQYVPKSPNFNNSIFYPLTFYWVDIYNSTPGNNVQNEWYSQDPAFNYNFLWSTPTGSKGVYDPCPLGWRVAIKLPSGKSPWYLPGADTASDITPYGVVFSNGFNFTASHYNIGWYPAAGTIASAPSYDKNGVLEYEGGAFREVGEVGYHMMATHKIRQADMIRWDRSSYNTQQTMSRRTYGMNVRCVADE